MTDPSSPQPDDERPVTDTPAERDDQPDHDLEQDDDLRAGQVGPDDTRP